MNRVAFILLASGFVLLLTWVVAPAAPSPSPLPAHAVEAVDQQAPLVAEMAAQVERMRNRLESRRVFRRRREIRSRWRAPEWCRRGREFPWPRRGTATAARAGAAEVAASSRMTSTASLTPGVFSENNGVKVLKAGDAIGPS
jgi:hypothetical protein